MHKDLNKLPNLEHFLNWYADGYVNKTINEVSVAELREALSYYYDITKISSKKVDIITENLNRPWPKLNLIEEAILLYRLRLKGYELELIDKFPNSIQDFKPIKFFKERAKIKFYANVDKFDKIKNFRHTYLIIILVLLAYFNNWYLLGWSLIITYVSWTFLEVAKHDYIEHRYIVPKNKILKSIFDFILYITSPGIYRNKSCWIKSHQAHHKYWKTKKDLFSYIVANNIVLGGSDSFNPLAKPDDEQMKKLLSEYKEFSWHIQYLREIEFVGALLIIYFFSFEILFYCVMLPMILKPFLEAQHDWYMLKFGERNYWFMFPISWNQSWHVDHHKTFSNKPTSWDDVFYGPKWIKYFNPQYYFARLFFKIN